MRLAMDLAACAICGGENGTNGCHLAGFSEDVTFACHFVATCQPPPSHPIGVLLVLAMPVKKLSEMMGNSASYSANSWWMDRL